MSFFRRRSLLADVVRGVPSAFVRGNGKAEPLDRNLSGRWSRRINQEHRLVYRVAGTGKEQTLQLAQCRSRD
jgi:Txe/YoeB family toxin of toxin-antitoxin system